MDFLTSFSIALKLLLTLDSDLLEIIGLSMRVSVTAVFFGLLVGLPAGACLASLRFPGRQILIIFFNTLLSMPPVIIGLLVYMMLSRSGPFGFLDILYSPAAMMIAQFILVAPLAATGGQL